MPNHEKLIEVIKSFKGTRFRVRDVIARYNLKHRHDEEPIEECQRNFNAISSLITMLSGVKTRMLTINGEKRKCYDWV